MIVKKSEKTCFNPSTSKSAEQIKLESGYVMRFGLDEGLDVDEK